MEENQRRALVVAGAVAAALVAVLVVWLVVGHHGDAPAPTSTTTSLAVGSSTTASSVPDTADTTSTTVDGAPVTSAPSTTAPSASSSSTSTPTDASTTTTTAPDDGTTAENARLVSECLGGDVDACFEVGSRQLPPPGDFGGTKYAQASNAVVEEACFDNKVAAACYFAGVRGLPLAVG